MAVRPGGRRGGGVLRFGCLGAVVGALLGAGNMFAVLHLGPDGRMPTTGELVAGLRQTVAAASPPGILMLVFILGYGALFGGVVGGVIGGLVGAALRWLRHDGDR